jgi:hypothetical protein
MLMDEFKPETNAPKSGATEAADKASTRSLVHCEGAIDLNSGTEIVI